MKFQKTLDLMFKYSECRLCGNGLIGAGEGSLHVDDDTFLRICKCGWFVEIKDGVVTNYNANN